MTTNRIKNQIINTVFEYDYKKELDSNTQLRVILNSGKAYNCNNINTLPEGIEIELNNNKLKINYADVYHVFTL